jgi:serine O-acetyltransferase
VPGGCVCEDGGLFAALREDLDRYVYVAHRYFGTAGPLAPLRIGLLSQGLWATTAYRLNHYARYRLHSRLLSALTSVVHRFVMALTRIHIDSASHIGAGLKFSHGGPIILGPERVGRNCDIFQYVTLGGNESTVDEYDFDKPHAPILGDRVHVGPGAVIAGPVTVGDDVAVGANSLVVRDVPPRAVVVGVPARLVSRNGSFKQVLYRGMADDGERSAALADPESDIERSR